MKNALKKWLGIEDLESGLKAVKTEPRQDTLRRLIGEAMEDALKGKEDSPWCEIPSWRHIPNLLERALESASRKTAGEIAAAHIEHRIGGEAFIDEVVARIQRKQLT